MGIFAKMEEMLAGTAFYQTYMVKWPPPFNIASFDVCLLLFLMLLFICPAIRDAIVSRIERKRELSWLLEYQRRKSFGESALQGQKGDAERKRRVRRRRKKTENGRHRKKTGRQREEDHAEQESREVTGGLEIVDEDYFFDEEDKPYENKERNREAFDFPSGRLYQSVYGAEEAGNEAFDEAGDEISDLTGVEIPDESLDEPDAQLQTVHSVWELEALTEMDDKEIDNKEIDNKEEDEFTRLMKKIRKTQEEKEEAKLLAGEQEESRRRNLDEIDRRLTEKMRSQDTTAEQRKGAQDTALEQAKRVAVNEKRAELERLRQRELKLQGQARRKKQYTKRGGQPQRRSRQTEQENDEKNGGWHE